jgi:hypothetical protein
MIDRLVLSNALQHAYLLLTTASHMYRDTSARCVKATIYCSHIRSRSATFTLHTTESVNRARRIFKNLTKHFQSYLIGRR